jgi:sigma-B regulation protein RsbU (phosphoserine phosphatase)
LEEKAISLQSGDVLVLYTDGINEAMNEANEEFGHRRLLELVAQHRHEPAGLIVGAVEAGLAAFCGARPPGDDRTLLIVRAR